MLRTINLHAQATPEHAAAALADAWPLGMVFHLQGLGPATDMRDYFDEMISIVGEPARVAENAMIGDREHQRTGEVWMEVRYDPSVPDAYRHSNQPQPLHTDGSYIPSFPNAGILACVSQAASGGETIFIDGRQLVKILERRNPGLLARLRTTSVPHCRSGDRRLAPVISDSDGSVVVNWNYFCVDPDADHEVLDLRVTFFSFLATDPDVLSNLVQVRLEPGEAVVWKDDRVLHGRNGFSPQHVSERFFWKAAFEMHGMTASQTEDTVAATLGSSQE